MNRLFLSLLLTLFLGAANAQSGYRIEVQIDDYEQPELFLAYYYGQSQYILDTVSRDAAGKFVFSGDEPLDPGMYLVVMAPNNNYFQLVIGANEQRFSVKTSVDNAVDDIVLLGTPDNQLLYDYLRFLEGKRPEAERLQQQMAAGENPAVQAQLDAINEDVQAYQRNLIAQHPKSFTAAIIKANLPFDYPDFEGSEDDIQMARYLYTKEHYFDNIDLADQRMLRTPFLFQRIENYVERLTPQHPDSLIASVDQILGWVEPAPETFKYYLIHFLNKYASSKIVGMDAVYVHLGLNYYAKGKAGWTDEEQLQKIVDNAQTLEPLLIGKTAPNIVLQRQDGSSVALHDVQSNYTVLYFWRYDCGHCKESTPFLTAFYEKFRDKGVKMFAVCVKFTDEVGGCWDYVKENAIDDWIHTVDPYGRSRFQSIYNVKTTPQIYILDQNKKILSKRIGAEQMEEVMEKIIEFDQNKGSDR